MLQPRPVSPRGASAVMTANADKRAAALALDFAATLTSIVAQRLDSTPEAVLAAAAATGQCSPEVNELRNAFGRLASACFPTNNYPPRKLRDLCRLASTKPPTWLTIAGLERGLEVTVEELFARTSGMFGPERG